jgi:inorganic pyrophosphatase
MKKMIQRLGPYDSKNKCLNVVIETPKGSQVKYNYDPETGFFGLSKAMPAGMVFPFNFGFVPGTLGEDGDPLDILILNEEPVMPGCLLKVRLLGVMEARQEEGSRKFRNDRLIGVAIPKETPPHLDTIKLDKKTLDDIEHFFVSYNDLTGKKFKVLGNHGPRKAEKMVRKAAKQQKKKNKDD